MNNTLAVEAFETLRKSQEQYKARLASFPTKTLPDGTIARDIPANSIEELSKMRAEMDEHGKAFERVNVINDDFDMPEMKSQRPANRLGGSASAKSEDGDLWGIMKAKGLTLGDMKRSKAEYDLQFGDERKAIDWLNSKTTVSTGAGFLPLAQRTGDVVPLASRPVQLLDFLPMIPTSQTSIAFMQQTTRTNNAAGKAEATAFDEAVLAWTAATSPIEKVGVFIPVTEVQLEDEPQMMSIIQDDLALMVRQELDRQITVGSGGTPTITGIFAQSSIQTQAKGTDTTLDALLKAITKVNVTGRANANVVVLHGTDHQNLALQRTADGLYILGDPSNVPMTRVWGLPIVKSEALTVTNGLVLDSRYFKVFLRKDVTVAVSDSHASLFIANTLTMRAHVRAGLAALRQTAACTVTGL
jgi:HK97 family phage major capsid protein